MWTIGVADRLRFPHLPASSEGGEMPTFAHIPTYTTVNKAIDIDALKAEALHQSLHRQ